MTKANRHKYQIISTTWTRDKVILVRLFDGHDHKLTDTDEKMRSMSRSAVAGSFSAIVWLFFIDLVDLSTHYGRVSGLHDISIRKLIFKFEELKIAYLNFFFHFM